MPHGHVNNTDHMNRYCHRINNSSTRSLLPDLGATWPGCACRLSHCMLPQHFNCSLLSLPKLPLFVYVSPLPEPTLWLMDDWGMLPLRYLDKFNLVMSHLCLKQFCNFYFHCVWQYLFIFVIICLFIQ